MDSNSAPSWNIRHVKSVEQAVENECSCHTGCDVVTFYPVLKQNGTQHMMYDRRHSVSQAETKHRRYSSANEKVTSLKQMSQSTFDISGSCGGGRTPSASSDSDLEKKRMLRKLKEAKIEVSKETKRFLGTMKSKLLNRQRGKVTPLKRIQILPEPDSRWARRPAVVGSTVQSDNSVNSNSTADLQLLRDVDSEYTTFNR